MNLGAIWSILLFPNKMAHIEMLTIFKLILIEERCGLVMWLKLLSSLSSILYG